MGFLELKDRGVLTKCPNAARGGGGKLFVLDAS